jgi:hypothetical protein
MRGLSIAIIGLLASGCDKLDVFSDARIADRAARDLGQREKAGADGPGADGTATFEQQGKVFWIAGPPPVVPLAGVKVCHYAAGGKSADCVSTDELGLYTISLPKGVETGLFYDKAGFESVFGAMVPMEPIPVANFWLSLWSEADMAAQFARIGATYPMVGKGAISITGPRGTTCSIVPAAGIGPFYDNSNGELDPSLTEITGAVAYFANVPPGDYTIFCHTKLAPCTRHALTSGWPSTSGTLRLHVFEGYENGCAVSCL